MSSDAVNKGKCISSWLLMHKQMLNDLKIQTWVLSHGGQRTMQLYHVVNTHHASLRHVNIQIAVLFISSQILLLHKSVNSVLNNAHLRHKVTLHSINRLILQLLMRKLLLCFHNPHNRCIQIVLPISLDVRLSSLVFLSLSRTTSQIRGVDAFHHKKNLPFPSPE